MEKYFEMYFSSILRSKKNFSSWQRWLRKSFTKSFLLWAFVSIDLLKLIFFSLKPPPAECFEGCEWMIASESRNVKV